jgi:uncharacterized protein (DUF983 family)
MFKKGSKLYSVLWFKCPRCNQGDLYPTPTFSFKEPFSMNEKCQHCEQKYTLEPGFYYGAMFLSYILTAFMLFGMFAFFKFGLGMRVIHSAALATMIIAILFIWIFRVARSLWLSFFVNYDEKLITK